MLNKIFFAFLTFSIFFHVHGSLAAKEMEKLSNIGFIDFLDKTNDNNFSWMRGSIPEAIAESMKNHFVFQKTSPQKINNAAKLFIKKNKTVTQEIAISIAAKSNSHYLIFGDFSYDKKENVIIINSFVYHKRNNLVIKIKEVKNAIDNTIFNALRAVAKENVKAIYRYSGVDPKTIEKATTEYFMPIFYVADKANNKNIPMLKDEIDILKLYFTKNFIIQAISLEDFKNSQNIKNFKYPQSNQRNDLVEWLRNYQVKKALILNTDKKDVLELMPFDVANPKWLVKYSLNEQIQEKEKKWQESAESLILAPRVRIIIKN
jgi:hypothetical protein